MKFTQESVTLGASLKRRMANLADAIAKQDLAAPAWLAGLNGTELARLAMSLGIEALEKEHRLR